MITAGKYPLLDRHRRNQPCSTSQHPPARRRAVEEMPDLRAKLQSNAVEVDDIINGTLAFDGYSAEGSGVDLLG